jgi:hypothetical protein
MCGLEIVSWCYVRKGSRKYSGSIEHYLANVKELGMLPDIGHFPHPPKIHLYH